MKYRKYKNKSDILRFLDDTDVLILHSIEERVLQSMGYDVEFTLNESEFKDLLIERDIATHLMSEK